MTRKQERVELNQSITVSDIINGGLFGELINVTTEGLMVMTDKNIPTHAIYQLSLTLPTPILGSNSIEVGADCLWCKAEENFNRHWAGLHIIDASEQAMAQLAQLIDHYKK
ncbi:PilZ domain-containing protein [Dasania marina]|uniref:PilZ domain-containing protein n=1 Tax=Dasania marina TaxID=471499 RepID=UPI0003658E83|nr:PilZ domain-containing protein [Dasania marina]